MNATITSTTPEAPAAGLATELDAGEAPIVMEVDDFLHLWALIELAQQALPNSTDDDHTRAALRAVMDLLLARNNSLATPPRSKPLAEVARQAAMFIMRLADCYKDGGEMSGYAIEQEDLTAIVEAGRVVLNAVQGEGTTEELDAELQRAMRTATVLLTAQPPKATGLPPVFEGPVVQKRQVVEALEIGRAHV